PDIVGDANELADYKRALERYPDIKAIPADPPYSEDWAEYSPGRRKVFRTSTRSFAMRLKSCHLAARSACCHYIGRDIQRIKQNRLRLPVCTSAMVTWGALMQCSRRNER